MKNLLLLYLLVAPILLFGQNKIQEAVDSFSEYWAFKNAGITITVRNTEDGSLVASHNSDMALAPASIVKLFSTASAFEFLGADYKPKTELYLDGEVNAEGTLNGDVFIRALGDPTLGSKYFTTDATKNQFLTDWSNEILAAGIKKIKGQVIVDGSAFGYQGAPSGWTWGDMGNYYGAGPSAVVVHDNILNYYFKTAGIGVTSELIKTEPEIEGLRLLNTITGQKVSGDNSLIFGAPFDLEVYASGSLPYGRRNYKVKGTVPDPEKLLSKLVHDALIASGVEIEHGYNFNRNLILENLSHRVYSEMTLLKSYEGKTIEEIAFVTNMKSINIFAEQMLCLVGFEEKGVGSTNAGLDVVEAHWKSKLGISNLHIQDGSGLSRSNGISSNQFTLLLNYMSKSDHYEVYKSTLPVAGKSGTLRNVCKDQLADGRVFAKSGTMSRVKSYAGYAQSKSGKLYSFSMTVNNYNCSNSATVKQMEKIFNAMAVN